MTIKPGKGKKNGRMLVELSAFVLAGLLPLPAGAQSLSCPQPLIFGDVMACGSANTVVVRPDNTRQVNGCLSAGGAPFSRARCVVTQSFPYQPIQVSITAATYAINSGGNSMDVNNFNIVTNAGGRTTTVTAPFVNVPIGASLNVSGGQAAGAYSGTFTVNAVLQ